MKPATISNTQLCWDCLNLIFPVYKSTGNITRSAINLPLEAHLNLDNEDQGMFELYWRKVRDGCKFQVEGHESLISFADKKRKKKNLCQFFEPNLKEEIKKLHKVVNRGQEKEIILIEIYSATLLLKTNTSHSTLSRFHVEL